MTGILLDIVVLLAIVGFAHMGVHQGAVTSLARLITAALAAVIAIALTRIVGAGLAAVLPGSKDLARIIAMVGVGIAAYAAFAALAPYFTNRMKWEPSRWTDRSCGALFGGALGAGWTLLMVALVMLMPADNVASRAAISSYSGALMIESMPGALQWLTKTFPHYTQTLPKGTIGAVTKQQDDIVLHLTRDPRRAAVDQGVLFANINKAREDRDLPQLIWNLEISRAAVRHSRAMLNDSFFGYKTPAGLRFKDRMKAAIGNNILLYDEFGEQIVWAHDVPTAYAGIIASRRARGLLLDPTLTEIGIGAVDGGWFSGMMFTIGVVSRAGSSIPAEEATDGSTSEDIVVDGTEDTVDDTIDSTEPSSITDPVPTPDA
jgi:uncharacterized protein YkwD